MIRLIDAQHNINRSTGFQPVPKCVVASVIALLLLITTGCVPKHAANQKPLYLGPTESMRDVVAAINANNARVPSIWSRGYFEADIVDRGRSTFVNGDLLLLYRGATDLRIVGKKDIAGTVFEIGSNAQRYWLIVRGEADTMWWGNHESASIDPKQIPIQPDLMLEVLGVGSLNTNFLEPPIPVMRFNNDADVYMFVWNAPQSDRWIAQKEVWYDRQTKLPVKVILFDANGRVVLRADLSNHQSIDGNENQTDAPKIAANYRLYFPDSGTKVTFELSRPALKNGPVPNDRSFAFPGDNAGVRQVIQVDEDAPNRPSR